MLAFIGIIYWTKLQLLLFIGGRVATDNVTRLHLLELSTGQSYSLSSLTTQSFWWILLGLKQWWYL